jgi:HAD superfamily hydrolase (TIGR01509 family)
MSRPAFLQAIIFDFDGVIANSEPLHLRAFQQALGDTGIVLTSAEYFANYLGYDDVGVFEAVSRERELGWSAEQVRQLVSLKGDKLQQMLAAGEVLFRGAADFVRQSAAVVPIAIASGALRHEIDEIVGAAGLASLFSAIVASGDTPHSKPSPGPYQLAFDRLSQAAPAALDPSRCIAIEDSHWGLESARGAGLRCVGVTNSYPAEELSGAELVVSGLDALTIEMLDRMVSP